jgi:hypothetical protein
MKNHLGAVVGVSMLAVALVVLGQVRNTSVLQGSVNPDEPISSFMSTASSITSSADSCRDQWIDTNPGSATGVDADRTVAFAAAMAKAKSDCSNARIATPPPCPDGCKGKLVRPPFPVFSSPPNEETNCTLSADQSRWICTVTGVCRSLRICGGEDSDSGRISA